GDLRCARANDLGWTATRAKGAGDRRPLLHVATPARVSEARRAGNPIVISDQEGLMDLWEWIVLGVAVGAVVLLALAFVRIRRRRSHLKQRFGPEYGKAVADRGVGDAESHLGKIEDEHDELQLRELPSVTRDRYFDEWRQAEVRFRSDPPAAAPPPPPPPAPPSPQPPH